MEKSGHIIGIAGMSRSGKTTLTLNLAKKLKGTVQVLHLDDFVFSEDTLPLIDHNGEQRIDWEQPTTLDFMALQLTIEQVKGQFDWILVEGFFLFYNPLIRALFSKKIVVQIDFELFWERRKASYTPAEPDWYIQHVWDTYQMLHRPFETDDTLILQALDREKEKIALDFIL